MAIPNFVNKVLTKSLCRIYNYFIKIIVLSRWNRLGLLQPWVLTHGLDKNYLAIDNKHGKYLIFTDLGSSAFLNSSVSVSFIIFLEASLACSTDSHC